MNCDNQPNKKYFDRESITKVLRYYYKYHKLAEHPLAELFANAKVNMEDSMNTPGYFLQSEVLSAIQELQKMNERDYTILHGYYIEKIGREELENRFDISPRTFDDYLRSAKDNLSEILYARYKILASDHWLINSEGLNVTKVRHALAQSDYDLRINSFIDEFSDAKVCEFLIIILEHITENVWVRIRALESLSKYPYLSDVSWDLILSHLSTELLSAVIRILPQTEIILDEYLIQMMFKNPALPKSSKGFGNMVMNFIAQGADYTSSVFEDGGANSSWEIRLDCVRAIRDLNDEDSLETLSKFSHSTYHIIRKIISRYIDKKIEERSLNEHEVRVALQIMEQVADDKTHPPQESANELSSRIYQKLIQYNNG